MRVVVAADQHDVECSRARRATRSNAASSAATRPARACRKSPSTTRRVAPVRSISARQAREIGGGRRRAAAARRRRGTPRPCRGARRRRTACARAASRARARRSSSTASPPTTWRARRRPSAVARAHRAIARTRVGRRCGLHMRVDGTRPTRTCGTRLSYCAGTFASAQCMANCSGPAATRFRASPRDRVASHDAQRCRGFPPTCRSSSPKSPFLERFGEAAHAGFRAVEFAFPYEYQVKEIVGAASRAQARGGAVQRAAGRLRRPAIAASRRCPGASTSSRRASCTALRYAQALHCPRLHVMAGVLPDGADADGARRAGVRTLRAQPALRLRPRRPRRTSRSLIEPINPRDMPGYLLSTQARGARDPRRGRRAEPQGADGPLPRADRRGRSHREAASAGCRTSATSRSRACRAATSPTSARSTTTTCSSVLDELKYDGWVGCEYQPATTTAAGLTWLYRLLDRKRSAVGNL